MIPRRDFLLLRTMPSETVAELSGQALYMQSLDAALTHRTDDDGVRHAIDSPSDWLEQTVAGLQRRLTTVDVVRVIDREWLDDGPLGRAVDEVLAGFRARGGRVVLGPGTVTSENAAVSANVK
jgi:hypothetical protein